MGLDPEAPEIVVFAGTNGAGKSSLAGVALEIRGGSFYDPDRATRAYIKEGLSLEEANSRAWHRGREQLERAIREGLSYTFETTLGGRTMTRLLFNAVDRGHVVRIWYVGLASPELHIRRVKERVAAGGHDIAEERIRARWDAGRKNLIRLLPHVSELVVHDNSRSVDIRRGEAPLPVTLLHTKDGELRYLAPSDQVPDWAKPVLAAAIRMHRSG